jgi:transposase
MGAPKKADWREERRKQAWKLKEEGWQQKDIAGALGVSEGAVSQWLKRGRAVGVEALKAHPPKGMTPRLTAEQKAQIPTLLAKGSEAYGFRGGVWTARRVAEVIHRTDRACALIAITSGDCSMRQAGVGNSLLNEPPSGMKKPSRRGMRSAGRLSKKAEEDQSTIVWVDEAGFYLLPMAVRTWATACAARPADVRSSGGYQWHHLGRTPFHASAPRFF